MKISYYKISPTNPIFQYLYGMAAPVGNKFAVGNTGGRPPHFESRDALEAQISGFFDSCKEDGTKATVTGLALYLGFCSRSSLDDYAGKDDEFSYTIKRAKLAVENSYEQSGGVIDIFALKNMGWKDKTEQDLHVSGGITWNEQKTYETKDSQ